jgi:hypothetical protein
MPKSTVTTYTDAPSAAKRSLEVSHLHGDHAAYSGHQQQRKSCGLFKCLGAVDRIIDGETRTWNSPDFPDTSNDAKLATGGV